MQPAAETSTSTALKPYFKRLQSVFADMDRAYEAAAAGYGFKCDGCADNCCESRFYHHTYAEYHYLMAGISQLDQPERRGVFERALDVVNQTRGAEGKRPWPRLMCPLNQARRCLIYAHRPMICRLHGVPHQLVSPHGKTITGPGCGEFSLCCGQKAGKALDRTPFYMALSRLERELREHLGAPARIKMTVAEMIVTAFGAKTGHPFGEPAHGPQGGF